MIWLLLAFFVCWTLGWVALLSQTIGFQTTFFGKVKAAFVLFFIWPIIVIGAANSD